MRSPTSINHAVLPFAPLVQRRRWRSEASRSCRPSWSWLATIVAAPKASLPHATSPTTASTRTCASTAPTNFRRVYVPRSFPRPAAPRPPRRSQIPPCPRQRSSHGRRHPSSHGRRHPSSHGPNGVVGRTRVQSVARALQTFMAAGGRYSPTVQGRPRYNALTWGLRAPDTHGCLCCTAGGTGAAGQDCGAQSDPRPST